MSETTETAAAAAAAAGTGAGTGAGAGAAGSGEAATPAPAAAAPAPAAAAVDPKVAALQAKLDAVLAGPLDTGGCRVTLTMHDLPEWPHWRSDASQTSDAIVAKVLAGLEAHGVTGVYNFANSGTGMLEDDDATTLPYNPVHLPNVEAWVAAGHHIANHTHSHIATYETTEEDLKADVLRADKELAPWLAKAPSKLVCFCTDCQGDTAEAAEALAAYVRELGYTQLPAASMVYEWRWELAYLGILASGDEAAAADCRAKFVAYSVAQTLADCRRAALLPGCADFVPSLLLHMLNIVADTMGDWLAALKAAGFEFVAAEETLGHPFWAELEGQPDPVHAARPAAAKVAEAAGLTWPESAPAQEEIMKWVREAGEAAIKSGAVKFTEHLGARNINTTEIAF